MTRQVALFAMEHIAMPNWICLLTINTEQFSQSCFHARSDDFLRQKW
jgi:hypothetical protein